MKILAACLFCAFSGLARSAFADEQPATPQAVKTSEIRKIEFDSASGALSFAVGGRRYVLPGHFANGGLSDASVAANLAILNELRHANEVTLLVTSSLDPQKRIFLKGITFTYDALK